MFLNINIYLIFVLSNNLLEIMVWICYLYFFFIYIRISIELKVLKGYVFIYIYFGIYYVKEVFGRKCCDFFFCSCEGF